MRTYVGIAILFSVLLFGVSTRSRADEDKCFVVKSENRATDGYGYYIVSTIQEQHHLFQNGVPGSFAPSISYRFVRNDAAKDRRCILEFTSDSSALTIELGEQHVMNWYFRSENELVDLNGDGLFDSRRLDSTHSQIRVQEKLLDIINKREITQQNVRRPIKFVPDFSLPLPEPEADRLDRVYVFESEQWKDMWQDKVINDKNSNNWVFAKMQTTPLPKNSEIQRHAAIYDWKSTHKNGKSIALHPIDKSEKQGDVRILKLMTDFGHQIELRLNLQGKVIHWQLKNIAEVHIDYDDRGNLIGSEFRIGEFSYIDSDGDRVFDSLNDQKRAKWFLLRADDLLPVDSPTNTKRPIEFPDKSTKTMCHRLENHIWVDVQN
jgi:hypothetical protein